MARSAPRPDRGSYDPFIDRLQTLREAAGNPSYAEIARRVTQQRSSRGLDQYAAMVPRTTVYDALRAGRARPNLQLLREVAAALGADDAQVDTWLAACRTTVPAPPVPTTGRSVLLLMGACVVFNLFGRIVVDLLALPVYLDMWGTAIAAIALGPWRGAVVGGATNLVGVAFSGLVSVPFMIVNIVGALVWGYGVSRFGMGRTLPRFLALNLLVAAACSLVAIPILVFMFGGSVGQGQDSITQTFLDLNRELAVAVGLSNVLTSVGDKLISGFVALVAISMLPVAMRNSDKLVGLVSPTGR